MKQSILMFSLFLYSAFTFCQDTYLSLSNETIHGTIVNYKEWSKNPSAVLFKDSSTGNSIELTPINCKGFTAGSSDKFISYSGNRILNSDKIENIHSLQSDTLIKDSIHVFLREIYQFKDYTLYKLFDDKRTNFYLADNGNIKELEYYEYVNETKQVVPYDAYKNYLLSLFTGKGINNLEQKADRLNYKESELINFLANTLGDKNHSTEKLRNKFPSEVLIGLGVNANSGTITFSTGTTYHQTSISPSFDIGLRIYSQRNFGRLFFQPSINITPLSNTFNESLVYKAKATLVSFKLGPGYEIVKKPLLSFYGAAQLGITFFYAYENGGGGEYRSSTIDKLTIHPELGVILKRKINIAVTGTFPVKLPSNSESGFPATRFIYKISQVYLLVRYVL